MKYKFPVVTAIMTFLALLIGDLVNLTDSGDACGTDWPKCNGSIIPDFTNIYVLIEYSHRIFTGLLGFVILFNFILIWKNRKKLSKYAMYLALSSMVLLLAQSLVGGFNVLLGTPPGFTTLDVIVSFALLLNLTILAVHVNVDWHSLSKENVVARKKITYVGLISFLAYYLEVLIGAFFKHSRASKTLFHVEAKEKLIDSIHLADLIYNLHGILTVIVFITALWIFFHSLREQLLIKTSLFYIVIILINGLLGALTANYQLSLKFSSIHTIVATFTMLIIGMLIGQTSFIPRQKPR